jgi:DNA repair photolyase
MPKAAGPSVFPRARGSATNPPNRFERLETVAFDDGWPGEEEDRRAPPTTVLVDHTKSILAKNDSPDIAFDISLNPYRGCEHGCVYCFARPNHAYLGFSPGLDFETKLVIKPEAPRLLAAALAKPGYRCTVLAIGTNTDPYQPIERRQRIMRGCLEVLAAHNHPVAITTKSHLVTRDIDILAPMAAKRLAAVAVSITTLDRDLCRRLEPRAATPAMRLETVRRLAEAGIPVTVMVAPVIPLITDHELEHILAAAKQAGASRAGYILLRLPHEVKDLFAEWLEAHCPDKARHVLSLIRQSRCGRLYDSSFGKRKTGEGVHAEMLAQRFRLAEGKLGFVTVFAPLDTGLFAPPRSAGEQLSLL